MIIAKRPVFILFVLCSFIFSTSAHSEPSDDSASLSELFLSQMIWVEGGEFSMGSNDHDANDHEKPAHLISLDGFYIAKTELTQGMFVKVMGWNNSYFQCETCPMNNLSWSNIQTFIGRLNQLTGQSFRLPSEAEWEFAARGGVHSKGYRFSGSNDINAVAWYAANSERKSHPVAQKQANELGLFDMTGNLWEFCQDDLSQKVYQLRQGKTHNPIIITTENDRQKSMKIQRGGGYEFSPSESYIYRRDGATNNVRMPDIGFRLAMSKE